MKHKYTVGSSYNTKIKIIKDTVEVIEFDTDIVTGIVPTGATRSKQKIECIYPDKRFNHDLFNIYIDSIKEEAEYRKASNKEKSLNRSKNRLYDLIKCNHNEYGEFTKFVTLTFKDNVTDFDQANKEFNKFISRLNYYVFKVKERKLAYVGIREPQERGAIHYHLIFFNLPYLPKDILDALWRQGSKACKIEKAKENKLDDVEDVAKYVTKYMTKNFWKENSRDLKKSFYFNYEVWGNKKAYFTSKNLKQPLIYRITKNELKEDVEFALEGEFVIIDVVKSKVLEDGSITRGFKKSIYKEVSKQKIEYIKAVLPSMTMRFSKRLTSVPKVTKQVVESVSRWKRDNYYTILENKYYDYLVANRNWFSIVN